MLDRYVTAPDGMQWIVGRRFLFGPPRYIGFRFGRSKIGYEPARVRRVPPTAHAPRSPSASVQQRGRRPGPDESPSTSTSRRHHGRYRHSSGTIFVPIPSGRGWGHWGGHSSGSWGGSGSGGGGSSSRGGGGSSSRSSGGSSSRGGGGGAAAGGAAGLGAVLIKFLQVALIVIAIAAATAFTIFVLIPALIFLAWAALVGMAIAWHTVTKRPWIVEARENRDAPDVIAWAVVGWDQSRAVRDEIANAIASGQQPEPAGATRVDVADADPVSAQEPAPASR